MAKYWRLTLGWLVIVVLGETTEFQLGPEHLITLGIFAIADAVEFISDNLQISLFGKDER